ncbi:MAG: glycoside hydrolase family 127 protein, partial [Eubacteriaceae bacterium]|nr:glycoside hydrolase family 127 protein [Eubacteriaceae bacterium]
MIKGFRWAGGFMEHFVRLATQVMIPYQEEVLRDPVKSGSVDNFVRAAQVLRGERIPDSGDFTGMVFQDSDVYKWIEAAAYSLAYRPDDLLRRRVEEMVALVAASQEGDGYLDTYFILGNSDKKFTNLMEAHELYCAGHMIEAASSLYESLGDDSLLKVAEKNAALLYKVFITEGREGFSGHPEIELALMRLRKSTGKEIYRDLARQFIDVRGADSDFFVKEEARRDWSVWGMDTKDKMYAQYHLPVREQKDAVGHSVRAMYLYTAMAMLAEADGDESLAEACFNLFDSVADRR